MSNDGYVSIKEAAELCGLTPSVLRVWEFRYGWPSPKRRSNGYRAFTRAQLDELRRVSNLIKNGMSIGTIIIDGFPRWPSQLTEATKRFPSLTAARALPVAAGADLKNRALTALEQGVPGKALAICQSACMDLRPKDEVAAAILPCALAIAELDAEKRQIPGIDDLRTFLTIRAKQLVHRCAKPGQIEVESQDDDLLAAVTAVKVAVSGGQGRYIAGRGAERVGSTRVTWFGDSGTVAVGAIAN